MVHVSFFEMDHDIAIGMSWAYVHQFYFFLIQIKIKLV